jgi:succinate dehydrogenase/fumarate reductase flavoprotein subunit
MTPAPATARAAREVARWDDTADVVVVGLGCAGACASIEAARSGADVRVLERAGGGGGTSALSGGLLYLGGGTPVQEKCGFEDTPDNMFSYLMAACGPGPDEEKIRLFCERSVAHYHWLVELGLPFKASFHPESGGEPPTDDGLVYSGSENAWPFDRLARPAPRGHHPRTPGAAGGLLMRTLLAGVEQSGARVRTGAHVVALFLEPDGRVAGVATRALGGEQTVRARRGVVLTAGGFVNDKAMLRRHAPLLARCKYRVGSEGDDGSGIRLGLGAGAAAIRMDAGDVSLPFYPPHSLMHGLLVNRHGQRFINEDAYFGRIGEFALLRQDGVAWLIVDDSFYAPPRAGMPLAAAGDSVEELERELGMPEGALQATVGFYNEHAGRGKDPLFHKASRWLRPLAQPPFGAIDCTTDNALYAVFTLGGLLTRPSGEVLTPEGAMIPGLFAAGRTTSGVAAQGYSSGLSLADASFFGRLAGRRAATGDGP